MPLAQGANRIRGIGPIPARVAFFGECPTLADNFKREPLQGKAGVVLTTFWNWHGFTRKEAWVSNVCQYWPGRGKDGKDLHPDSADLARDEQSVMAELIRVRPEVVVALGVVAAEWFLGPVDIDVVNGIPHKATRKGLEHLVVFPVVHPAAGLHEPRSATFTWLGLREVARFLKGDPLARKVWQERTLDLKVQKVSAGIVKDTAAVDTEGSQREPWCLSYATDSRQAHVILAAEAPGHTFARTTFHHAKHDVPVLKALGVSLLSFKGWEDTMLMAHATAEHPYGLKALAYRFLNVNMTGYEKLVMPHLQAACLDTVSEIAAVKWDAPKPVLVFDEKKRLWREYQAQPLHKRAWRLLQAHQKGKPVDALEWIEKLTGFDRGLAASVGPLPSKWTALRYVPEDTAVFYAGLDAWATFMLEPILVQELQRLGRYTAYKHDQMILDGIVEMESHALPFDVDKCATLDAEFAVEEKRAERKTRKVVGKFDLNLSSPKQVSAVLTELGAVGRRLTLSGAESSDEKTLEMLRDSPRSSPALLAFLDSLLVFRGWSKNRGTYTLGLPKHVRDGGIYPHLSQTRAISGRLASDEPNLQNIPSRDVAGMKIRACFVAPPGWTFLAADLSQIELRLGAHLSNDPEMVAAFLKGEDLHEKTRLHVFRADKHLHDPAFADSLRKRAKTGNFSVFYGITPQGLHARFLQMGVRDFSVEGCAHLIQEWFTLYRGVRDFLDDTGATAKRQGFVSTEAGRARYLPMARLAQYGSIEAEAIRQAGNHRVQGTASEILKRAIYRWSDGVRAEVNAIAPTHLLLQIHDELLLLTRARGRKLLRIAKLIKEMLEADSDKYRVPILAECKFGPNWGEMEKIK